MHLFPMYLFYNYMHVTYFVAFTPRVSAMLNTSLCAKKSETINTVTLGRLSDCAWTNPVWFFRNIITDVANINNNWNYLEKINRLFSKIFESTEFWRHARFQPITECFLPISFASIFINFYRHYLLSKSCVRIIIIFNSTCSI